MREPPFHVWVDVTNSWANPGAGVLLAWRKDDRGRGWEAWVMYASSYSTGHGLEVRVTQSWVPAHLVRPAEAPMPERDYAKYRPAGERSR